MEYKTINLSIVGKIGKVFLYTIGFFFTYPLLHFVLEWVQFGDVSSLGSHGTIALIVSFIGAVILVKLQSIQANQRLIVKHLQALLDEKAKDTTEE